MSFYKTVTKRSIIGHNSSKKKKEPVTLAPQKAAPPPPSETTRLLTKILDGKQRPKKRSKNSTAAGATASKRASSQAPTANGWSSRLSGSSKRPATAAAAGFGSTSSNGARKNASLQLSTSTTSTATTTMGVTGNNYALVPKRERPSVPATSTKKVAMATTSAKKIMAQKNGKENNTTKTTSIGTSTNNRAITGSSSRPSLWKKPPTTAAAATTTTTTTTKANSNPYSSSKSRAQQHSNESIDDLLGATNPKKTKVDSAALRPSSPMELNNDSTLQQENAAKPPPSSKEKVPTENTAAVVVVPCEKNQTVCQQQQVDTAPKEQDQLLEVSPKSKSIPIAVAGNDADNHNQEQLDDTTSFKLGLSLPTSRSNAQRRKRIRSLVGTQQQQQRPLPNEGAAELEVLGAMLSSATKTAAAAAANKKSGSVLLAKNNKLSIGGSYSSSTIVTAASATTYDPRRDNGMSIDAQPVRLLPPMKALRSDQAADDDGNGKSAAINGSEGEGRKPARKAYNNDNFVRQNLRNSAGACRGARKKSRKFDKYKKGNYYQKNNYNNSYKTNDNGDSTQDRRPPQKETIQRAETFRAGVDPLDDYMDGVLRQPQTKESSTSTAEDPDGAAPPQNQQQAKAPECTRHQRPCKLLVVKKTATGNKGRKFYCCSMPRGEQCDHFQWADDTVEAAKIALLKNSSHTGFMARQVAAYSERFKKLTVPELREATKRRSLDSTGKKKQLLFRLSMWVRDELASVAPDEAQSEKDSAGTTTVDETSNDANADDSVPLDVSGLEDQNDDENGDSDSDSSASDDELEFFGATTERVDDLARPSRRGGCQKKDESCNNAFSDSESVQSEDLEVEAEKAPTNSVEAALFSLFGYRSIKDGQEWAINRCLQKQKSLLVAPTGFGKSMCYVLPAHLMDGVCIVVSPLISLIQDQLRELPPRVPAATLSGSLTTAATAAIVDDLIRKRIKVLFVSPERLASASFQRLFQPKWNKETNTRERPFPPVSLLCVDEAHCLSQWGHNFRPSYLRLKSLMYKIAPQSVLAITATAGHQVIEDICSTLGIDQCNKASTVEVSSSINNEESVPGVWTMKTDRENIDVKSLIVGTQELRLSMLVKLLKPCKPKSKTSKAKPGELEVADGSLAQGSVIVYVWRQRDAEVVAESLESSGVTGGVVHYHGGMESGRRANAYSKFMRGKARICVATVAFGLGVNKPDIVGIIHMYLPASPENHLQEIGRAGRDGRSAQAIALIVEEEALVRHSQSHSDLMSRSQIRSVLFSFHKLVRQTMESIDCESWTQVSAMGVAIPLHEFSASCDCKKETLETIFSLLELKDDNPTPFVQVEGVTLDKVTISLKRRKIEALREQEAVIRVIQSCAVCVDAPAGEKKEKAINPNEYNYERSNTKQNQFNAYSFGSYRFSVSQCANMLGPAAQPRHVFAALRRLQSNGEIELNFDKTAAGTALRLMLNKTGIKIFHGSEDDDGQQLEDLASSLTENMNSIATASANKVLDVNYIMHKVAEVKASKGISKETNSELENDDDDDEMEDLDTDEKSASLVRFQQLTGQYFGCPQDVTMTEDKEENLPNFVTKYSEREILIDAMSAAADILQYPNDGAGENALQLGNPETPDYTALAVTKFFHGMATERCPFIMVRQHRLFGKWQAIRFNTLLKTVQEVLKHQC